MEDMAGVNRRVIQWFPGHMAKTLRMMEKENPQPWTAFCRSGRAHPAFQPTLR